MTYPLLDTFSDPLGRWNHYAPWDATEFSEDDKGFLSTQSHVDVRTFRSFISDLIPVPQYPDLDTVAQTVLDSEPQTSLELKPGPIVDPEVWTHSGAGLDSATLTVGKIAARGGWSGLQITSNATTMDDTLTCGMTKAIDISAMDSLSIVFPDYDTFATTSYVELCSNANGDFSSNVSATVTFASNESTLPHLDLDLSEFATSGFDLTKVTGVRIGLKTSGSISAGETITVMAIRAVTDAWTEAALDFDTFFGQIVVPVTLDGNVYGGTVAQDFEFIRGDGTKSDPIPADGAMNVFFYPGGETLPNDAIDPLVNTLGILLREIKDIPDGTGSYIYPRLTWNDLNTNFAVDRVDITGGPGGTETHTTAYTEVIGNVLDPLRHYVFRVELLGTQLVAKLYETDFQLVVGNLVWQSTPFTSTDLTYRNGRVGLVMDLLNRDAYVDQFEAAPTGFAIFETKLYESRTPVDGAQLSAVYASDQNLWTDFTGGSDLSLDQTKTLSGLGSYKSTNGVTSNQFIIDDWTQSYLDFDIWVPNEVNLKNQPIILFNTDSGSESLVMPKLQPAQWNHVRIDLGLFRLLLTGLAYSVSILPATAPDKPLGAFWIDNMKVARRRVKWAARTDPSHPYRDFADFANDPFGAVHFKPDERGFQLQLKAEALTDDAWVASFNLFPRYGQLGLPIYDQGFETT